jgi:hypothetical protein
MSPGCGLCRRRCDPPTPAIAVTSRTPGMPASGINGVAEVVYPRVIYPDHETRGPASGSWALGQHSVEGGGDVGEGAYRLGYAAAGPGQCRCRAQRRARALRRALTLRRTRAAA